MSTISGPASPNYDLEELLRLANEARRHAYAPYSHFLVGAAILTKDGRVYTGCNIESASFTPTMCAERVAIGTAIAAGEQPGSFVAVAVVGDEPRPTSPCGVCRQVLAEIAPGATVIMAPPPEKGDDRLVMTIEELLPHGFTLLPDKD